MTGFGRATCEIDDTAVSMELSSVNHRYLDSAVRLPNEWSALDPALREALKEGISRGKINLTVSRKRQPGAAQNLRFSPEVASEYIKAVQELRGMLGTDSELSLSTLAQFNGVFYYEDAAPEDLEAIKAALLSALEEAIANLNEMRATEGASLGADLKHRVSLIREGVEVVKGRLPELNALYEEKLRARMRDLGEEANVTEDRLALEVAIMAERGDVTEEIVRLNSHLDHAEELLAADGPVGRKLNFLTQEIQREINTLGSKVRDTDVARQVLDMKSELEKIREQVQNIE